MPRSLKGQGRGARGRFRRVKLETSPPQALHLQTLLKPKTGWSPALQAKSLLPNLQQPRRAVGHA